jgi:hypothetical protein
MPVTRSACLGAPCGSAGQLTRVFAPSCRDVVEHRISVFRNAVRVSSSGRPARGSRFRRALTASVALLGVLAAGAGPAVAQETIGRRFFSDTLVIPEPFVEDELSLPTVLHIRRPGSETFPRARITDITGELKKRLTPTLELSVGGGLTYFEPDGASTSTRFDNLDLGLKYQYFASEAHEAVLSAFMGWEVGGTGQHAPGTESFGVLNPALLFGKGLGDLPDPAAWLKPLAVTGVLGALVPTRASTHQTRSETGELELPPERHPNRLQWGVVLEYSVPYLQAHVRDLHLPWMMTRLVPLTEIDLQTDLDRGSAGRSTGTVNPGLVWAGETVQVGVEAVCPVNRRTGKTMGVRAFVRIDLDAVLPGLGRPLFGGRPSPQ